MRQAFFFNKNLSNMFVGIFGICLKLLYCTFEKKKNHVLNKKVNLKLLSFIYVYSQDIK